jgi:hypothetical protein
MSLLVVFADRFSGRFYHRVYAVPFIVGIVQVELLGTEGACEGDLAWRIWRNVGSFESDQGSDNLAYSLFVHHKICPCSPLSFSGEGRISFSTGVNDYYRSSPHRKINTTPRGAHV